MKEIIYKIADLILLGRGIKTSVSGIKIRLPLRYYRYYQKNYEKDNVDFFKSSVKKGDYVLDIGAQMGLMTKIFCDLVGETGKVYSFEPTPSTFNLLKKTIEINNINTLATAFEMAVADKKGTAVFNFSNHAADGGNSLTKNNNSSLTNSKVVELTCVDSFMEDNSISKINFIKIDVEGAELAALKGAINTIKKQKPIINLALHPSSIVSFGDSLDAIYDLVTELNYNVIYKNKKMSREEFINNSDLFDVQLIN